MKWVRWCAVWICSLTGIAAAEGKLHVVTSFLPAYALTVNITKELAQVQNLLPGGVGLHDYQLSPRDVRQLSQADLIVINGLGMETFLDRALKNLGPAAKGKLVEMSRGLRSQVINEGEHDHENGNDHDAHEHGGANPHIWLDPVLAAHAVTNILKSLQRVDPSNADGYAKNAAEFVQRLHRLDRDLAAQLEEVKHIPFITYHNAFPYFVRRYGLSLAGVVEGIPEVSPSPREMSRLLSTIREKKVQALFTEPGENPRLAQRIAGDTGIALAELDPLETGELKATAYEDGMRRNAQTLVNTLK